MKQLQAGYFIEGIKEIFARNIKKNDINNILNKLSYFDLETKTNLSNKNTDPIASVINNIISRGLPTIPSTFIEDIFSTTFHKTKKESQENNKFSYNFINDEYKDDIYKALHIIEPRLSISDLQKNSIISADDKDKDLKEKFLFNSIPSIIGEYCTQLFSVDRKYSSLFEYTNFNFDKKKFPFIENEVDFSIELPHSINDKIGFSIEIDKIQQVDNTDYLSENEKNELLNNINWNNVLRIQKSDFADIEAKLQVFQYFTYNEFFDTIRKNFQLPLYKTPIGLDALQITLSPLAIARIQKTILQFILARHLNFEDEEWNIAIIERDVPAAFLAIEDLKQHFKKLFLLEGENRKLPKINLTIYYTEEFNKAELNLLYQGEKFELNQFKENEEYDLLLDVSTLLRSGFEFKEIKTKAKYFAKIRSINYINSYRKFTTTGLIPYQACIIDSENKTEEQEDQEIDIQDNLRYFLKNIFRHNNFSNEQLQFINKAIQLQTTVGIMPFTSNKTLLYQFVSILQPGISLIVNPIMPVMKEQFDKLRNIGIDGCYYINSEQIKLKEKQIAIEKFKNQEAIFTFISADRLHIEDFRKTLLEMNSKKIFFDYFIIDEIHCMSEWSHDYRLFYASLYENARQYCRTKNTTEIPILGFTGTASYDVITDIKTIVKPADENIINFSQEFDNLNFEFINVELDNTEQLSNDKDNIILSKLKNSLFVEKQNLLKQNLTAKAGTLVLINRVTDFYEKLEVQFPDLKIAKFTGTIDAEINQVSGKESYNSYNNYKKFRNNEIDVLVANRTIGIGLDKPDIRNIFFLNIPSSVESFIQQINRGARDLKTGNYKFIINNQIDKIIQQEYFNQKYGNAEKDLAILNELLTVIYYPVEKPIEILIKKIRNEFDLTISIHAQPLADPYQIHIYDEQDYNFGYIDYETNKIVNKASEFDEKIAQKILLYVKNEIEHSDIPNNEIFNWLKQEKQKRQEAGIERKLMEIEEMEYTSITVNFINDKFEKIAKLFDKKLQTEIKTDTIINSYTESFHPESFLQQIKKHSGFNRAYIPQDTLNELNTLYFQARNFRDTLKVISRLMTINLIDNYSIDYNKHLFEIFFTKENKQTIQIYLQNKLSSFVSKEKKLEIFEQLEQEDENTIFGKAANYYTSFIHEEIIPKHKRSADSISTIFQQGADNKNKAIFQEKATDLINNFFFTKYLTDLENNLDKKFEVVKNHINLIGKIKDNWLHLQNSTKKLLKLFPDNYILLILNGFSSILISPDEQVLVSNSIQKITDGLAIMRIQEKLKNELYLEREDFVFNRIYEQNFDLKKKINQLKLIKLHNSWLYNFNKKFLKK